MEQASQLEPGSAEGLLCSVSDDLSGLTVVRSSVPNSGLSSPGTLKGENYGVGGLWVGVGGAFLLVLIVGDESTACVSYSLSK